MHRAEGVLGMISSPKSRHFRRQVGEYCGHRTASYLRLSRRRLEISWSVS